jgi:hypothetical protein
VTPTTPLPGGLVTAVLRLRNDGQEMFTTTLSHYLPSELELVTLHSPALVYDAGTRHLTWTGKVAPGGQTVLSWTMRVGAGIPAGTALTPEVMLGLPAWKFAFRRTASLRVGGADLSASRWLVPSGTPLQLGQGATLTFALRNAGPGSALPSTVKLWMTAGLTPITATLPTTQGMGLPLWEGTLGAGETRVLTVPVRPWGWTLPLRIDALIGDGTGQRWERSLVVQGVPWRQYMPVVMRQ